MQVFLLLHGQSLQLPLLFSDQVRLNFLLFFLPHFLRFEYLRLIQRFHLLVQVFLLLHGQSLPLPPLFSDQVRLNCRLFFLPHFLRFEYLRLIQRFHLLVQVFSLLLEQVRLQPLLFSHRLVEFVVLGFQLEILLADEPDDGLYVVPLNQCYQVKLPLFLR